MGQGDIFELEPTAVVLSTSRSLASAGRMLAAPSSCWAARPCPRVARHVCCPPAMARAVSKVYRAMVCPGDVE